MEELFNAFFDALGNYEEELSSHSNKGHIYNNVFHENEPGKERISAAKFRTIDALNDYIDKRIELAARKQ